MIPFSPWVSIGGLSRKGSLCHLPGPGPPQAFHPSAQVRHMSGLMCTCGFDFGDMWGLCWRRRPSARKLTFCCPKKEGITSCSWDAATRSIISEFLVGNHTGWIYRKFADPRSRTQFVFENPCWRKCQRCIPPDKKKPAFEVSLKFPMFLVQTKASQSGWSYLGVPLRSPP